MANRGLEPLRVPEDFWHRDEVTAALRDRDIGMLFKLIRQHTGASQTQLGIATGLEQGYVSRIMAGRKVMAIGVLERIADGCAIPDHARTTLGLAAQGSLDAVVAVFAAGVSPAAVDHDSADQELESLELARRVTATDVGEETLVRLEQAVDDLATRYPVTPLPLTRPPCWRPWAGHGGDQRDLPSYDPGCRQLPDHHRERPDRGHPGAGKARDPTRRPEPVEVRRGEGTRLHDRCGDSETAYPHPP